MTGAGTGTTGHGDGGAADGHGPGPGRAAALGAAGGVVVFSAVSFALLDTGRGDGPEALLGLAVGTAAVGLASGLAWILLRPLRRLSASVLAPFAGAFLALTWLRQTGPAELLRGVLGGDGPALPAHAPDALSPLALAVFPALAAVLFATLGRLRLPRTRRTDRGGQLLLVCWALVVPGVLLEVRALAASGADPFPDDGRVLRRDPAVPVLPDPTVPGPFAVRTLTYGAGPNPRRPEFGVERDVTSRTVDATRILPEWRGFRAEMREAYWGFGLSEAPLNGRVWLPDAAGPRPLVLVVHGNHGMEDYSDDGYGYLGELLASHGFVTVSVDQNFVNGSWSGDFRGREMAARAWLLLEHLRLWRDWQGSPEATLAGTADLTRIALIGHSRGGEAVSIAAAFDALPAFPDDASVPFDYGFGIRALVAIAQVDQRYRRRVRLEDVDFLALHGSYDADEPAYHGLRQMNRITFTPGGDHFLAGAYVHRANHGQFNTGWGDRDYGLPGGWQLNVAPLLAAEEQRRAAQVFVHAFLRASLLGERAWRRALRDPRSVAPWLPPTTFVHQYQDDRFEVLADFEEDLDVTSATVPDGHIEAQGLARWRELPLAHRDGRPQGSRALELAPDDGGNTGPAWILQLPTPVPVLPGRVLSFRLSGSTERVPGFGDGTDAAAPPAAPALRVVAVYRDGTGAAVDPGDHAYLAPPLRTRFLKHAALDRERYRAVWEPVLQTVEIPLTAFGEPGRDGGGIVALRFEPAGPPGSVLWLDRIGWARAPGRTR